MPNTFQCPNCSSNNLIGQTFCITCGHMLEYDCPYCGGKVDPSISFCTSCGATLSWPEQSQPEPQDVITDKDSQQTPAKPRGKYRKSDRSNNRRWPIGLTVLIVVLLIAAGLIFAIDIFDLKLITPPASEKPITTPPPQTPPVHPAITPTILSFNASATEILLGKSIKLQWDVTDAEIVTIDPDVGEVQFSGELSISPETSTTYIITAKNDDETVTATVSVSVIENVRAIDIVLTEDDVKPSGFVFDHHSEPAIDNTISTFHVIFIRTNETFSITVFVFEEISTAEEYYLETKYNNRGNIAGITTLGDVGYFLVFEDEPPSMDIYSIRFIKNNVYANITGLKNYDELESFGKIIESRIH